MFLNLEGPFQNAFRIEFRTELVLSYQGGREETALAWPSKPKDRKDVVLHAGWPSQSRLNQNLLKYKAAVHDAPGLLQVKVRLSARLVLKPARTPVASIACIEDITPVHIRVGRYHVPYRFNWDIAALLTHMDTQFLDFWRNFDSTEKLHLSPKSLAKASIDGFIHVGMRGFQIYLAILLCMPFVSRAVRVFPQYPTN